ncbi:MAG: hypothetical protein ACNI26_13865 [Terasakiella sp.]|uniref:hypothetical protein n=1 Tax=unclassified Terasakiella TaxID=2614952 RepID=UPI003B00EFCA
MVAFLAALPAIFAAMKGAADLFDVGKQVVEEIKGEAVEARSPDELREEVDKLSEPERAQFMERMKSELAFYETISNRLMMQGGQLDAEVLNAIPPRARAQVALIRMTTRPWAVRWMVIAVVFPPLAIVGLNSLIAAYNVINAAFGTPSAMVSLIEMGDVLNSLYEQMVGWAAAVIMTYMGMREVGKAVERKDSVSVNDITGSLSRFVGNVKQVFR